MLNRRCVLTIAGIVGLGVVGFGPVFPSSTKLSAGELTFDGWMIAAPRDEIRPAFRVDSSGGPSGGPALVIEADDRTGLDGWWTKSFPIVGGKYYRFECMRRLDDVEVPRRSAVARVLWQDANGKKVLRDAPPGFGYRADFAGPAEPEYPTDEPALASTTSSPSTPWVAVSGTFQAPTKAERAVVELHLQWAPKSRATYADVRLVETTAPEPRKVRLAAVHFQPHGGGSPMGNCRLFEPLLADAARQKADLVVLPETLTYYGLGKTYAECAEPVPGPTTEYFGKLAKQHDYYVVVGLIERDRHLIYNTSVLLGPDGAIVGKYRKTTLPRSEIEAGVMPGDEYPVFDTRFGKVGMMICYDGFFPEVARQLSNRGAEVIAWPVWGCNPLLAEARACENHVYLVSSTYTPSDGNWIRSAVYDHAGGMAAAAEKFGTVAVAEVDLNRSTNWNSLGNYRAQLPHHRPLWNAGKEE